MRSGEFRTMKVDTTVIFGALVALGITIAPGKLRAEGNHWRNLGPEGGGVWSITLDPQDSSVVYAATGVGLFKSQNRGANWSNSGLTGYVVGRLAIDPHDSRTIYAVTLGRTDQDAVSTYLFKSSDGGSTWSQVDSGFSGFACCIQDAAVDPSNHDTVYLAVQPGRLSSGSMLKSNNGGRSWQDASAGLSANLLVGAFALDPQKPNILYVAGVLDRMDAVFKSTDGAATWQETDTGLSLPNVGIGGLTIDPTRSDILYLTAGARLFKSTDGASSWTALSMAGIRNNSISGAVVVDPQKPDTLFVLGGNGREIYKSTDGGASWTLLSSGLPLGPGGIAIDPLDSSTLYLATGDGAFKSSDGGASWTATKSGLRAIPVTSLAMGQGYPRTIYAGASSGYGLFKSTDAGSGWQAASAGIRALYPAESIVALAVDPQSPANLFAATSGVECGYGAGGMFRSTDGSASWTDTGVVSCMYGVAVDPQSPNTVYAATAYSGILKSTDGGQNWTPRNAGLLPSTLPGPRVSAIGIDPQRPNTIFGGVSVWDGRSHGGLFKSVDGALTWKATVLKTDGFALISSVAVDSQDSDTVYVAIDVPWYAPPSGTDAGSGGNGLWKTTDGGIDWRNLFSAMPVNVYAVLIDARDSNNVYAATDEGVIGSSDGGESWTLIPGSPAFSRVLALDSQDAGILYAAGLGGLFSITFCRERPSTVMNMPSVEPAERLNPRGRALCPDQPQEH